MATHTDNYTLGRGEAFFRKAGDTGFRFLGNSPTFNIATAVGKLEHRSSRGGISLLDVDIATTIDRTSTLALEDISLENQALIFLGQALTLSTTAIASAPQTFLNVAPGRLYQLGETPQNVTGVRNVTVTSVTRTSGTALTAEIDYHVDPVRGTIELLETGGIVAGDTLTVTYSVGASKRTQVIAGGTRVTGELRYYANNPLGANIDYYMPSVTITPNGDFALIAESALQSMPVSVGILQPAGRAAVYADGQATAM